jgi:MoaA/NifB/PqqE/SkfB family radical SAM enzyme
MLATWHWHIEISSKCTLRCPRCARQEVPDSLVNTELDFDFFLKAFSPSFIVSDVEKITFCGDDGDPIYAHDLIRVIKYIKSIKDVEIVIVTNGSYKTPNWWSNLGRCLTSKDSVHFSVDGYNYESNNLYRVNSDFASIMRGIAALRRHSDCQIVWAAIAFKFNEEHISEMQYTAKSLGVDRFQLTKSTKFGSIYSSYGANDPLEPSVKFVSSTHRFEREITQFTHRLPTPVHSINTMLFNKNKDKTPIIPLCGIGNKGLYLDSRGRVFPCCWVANRYGHNFEWQEIANKFDLHNRSMQNVLEDTFWTTEFQEFKWQECKTKCNSKVMNENYATSW